MECIKNNEKKNVIRSKVTYRYTLINLKNNCTNTITGNVNTISPYSCTLYKNKTCSNYTTIVHEKLSRLLLNIFEYSNVFADNSCLSPASLFFSFSCCCCSFVVRNKGNPLIRKGKLRKKIIFENSLLIYKCV